MNQLFTGIIQHIGTVISLSPTTTGAILEVDPGLWIHHAQVGESIAVNGCCLTVKESSKKSPLKFDVVHHTLHTTTLGAVKPGDPVNLEHAATPTTFLGGHIVQGHIDGVGVVEAVASVATDRRVRIVTPPKLKPYVIERGSIAVDGVSLTLALVGEDSFEVALIPTTLNMTTLSNLKSGSRVNLEVDYIAKIVVEQMRRQYSA